MNQTFDFEFKVEWSEKALDDLARMAGTNESIRFSVMDRVSVLKDPHVALNQRIEPGGARALRFRVTGLPSLRAYYRFEDGRVVVVFMLDEKKTQANTTKRNADIKRRAKGAE